MFLLEALTTYEKKHHAPPGRIVVTPLAALTMAASGELPRFLDGIPVVTREFSEADASLNGTDLGIFVRHQGKDMALTAVELRMSPLSV